MFNRFTLEGQVQVQRRSRILHQTICLPLPLCSLTSAYAWSNKALEHGDLLDCVDSVGRIYLSLVFEGGGVLTIRYLGWSATYDETLYLLPSWRIFAPFSKSGMFDPMHVPLAGDVILSPTLVRVVEAVHHYARREKEEAWYTPPREADFKQEPMAIVQETKIIFCWKQFGVANNMLMTPTVFDNLKIQRSDRFLGQGHHHDAAMIANLFYTYDNS